MGKLSKEYKKLFKDKRYVMSFIAGIFVLFIAGIATSLAFLYASVAPGSPVGDLILDNIPTIHLFWTRLILTALVTFSILFIGMSKPRYFPALFKTTGMMYIIRAFFISLTHLKAYPEKINLADYFNITQIISSQGNDLFFSGHVGLPFISALIFWKHEKIRNYLLVASLVMGIVMILSKSHYSIDIFAAPFMAYAIFKLSEKFFDKDFEFARKE